MAGGNSPCVDGHRLKREGEVIEFAEALQRLVDEIYKALYIPQMADWLNKTINKIWR